MVYKKHIRKNGKKFGPYYYESYREGGKVKSRFVRGPKFWDGIVERLKRNLTLIIMLIILLIFIGVLFFSSKYLSYSIEEKLYTGFVAEDAYGMKCDKLNFICDDWSLCLNGIKKRNCIYANDCGSFIQKENCVEEIVSTETPSGDGLNCDFRTLCELTYGIGNEFGRGVRKMSCEFDGEFVSIINVPCEVGGADISIEKIEEDKVVIYDIESKEKVAEVSLDGRKLDIDWVFG